MKKSRAHILCSILLILNLAFTQIGVGFLHDHATEEKEHVSLNEVGDSIEEAHPICELCKLNLFYELFYVPSYTLTFYSSTSTHFIVMTYDVAFSFSHQATGRAPPSHT